MVARYKVHKFGDKWNDGYFKPVFSDPDAAERQKAKQDIIRGMFDHEDANDLLLRSEAQWDEEMELASECHRMSEADPDYKCTCFDPYSDDDDLEYDYTMHDNDYDDDMNGGDYNGFGDEDDY